MRYQGARPWRRFRRDTTLVHRKFQVLLWAISLAVAIGVALFSSWLSRYRSAATIKQAQDKLAVRKAESLKGGENATLDGGGPVLDRNGNLNATIAGRA